MNMMIGFVLGYVFAWKAGLLELDKISQAWSDIKKSQETQALVGGTMTIAGGLLRQVLASTLREAINRR